MPFIPDDVTEIVSPFIGGGSFELALTGRGIRVYGYDAFQPLVTFWQELLKNSDALIPYIKQFVYQFYKKERDPSKDIFESLTTNTEYAAMFVVKNALTFNKKYRQNSFMPFYLNKEGEPILIRYTRAPSKAINYKKFCRFSNYLLSVEKADFRESLTKHAKTFAYLDPPYPESAVAYGDGPEYHEKFPHKELADILYERNNWILSYNNTDKVKALYPVNKFRYNYLKYQLSTKRDKNPEACNEVLIQPKEN